MPGVGHRLDARVPAFHEGLRIPLILLEDDSLGSVALAPCWALRHMSGLVNRSTELRNRLGDPRELHVLAVDDVLIGVVEVVLLHQPRARLVSEQ
jgi:hypothetical protein